MDYAEESLRLHYEWRGKLEIKPRVSVGDEEALSLAYTPGVARPCLEIQKDINKSFELTRRWNTVAVVTDGTAVLGLGDVGPEAGMPVMEGKCVLFKEFGGVDAFPLCVKAENPDEFVRTVCSISGSFGGINLEDIAAPRCFEIEKKLRKLLNIPVFHDDQHGTAVVVAAAVLNALRVVQKDIRDCTAAVAGAGAAGVAVTKLLLRLGLKNAVVCNSRGIICRDDGRLNSAQRELAELTNREQKTGTLAGALRGADIFIGVSAPDIVTPEMVRSMAEKPVVLAMANPTPEIMPELAKEGGAAVVGTGRSDFPNQINNVLAFPGIFRGALDCRAREINEEMKLAAVRTLASLISDEALSADCILPKPFDRRIAPAVADAVERAAAETGAARARRK